MLSSRLDGEVLPWDPRSRSDSLSVGDLEPDQRLGPLSGAATHQEVVLVYGSGDENKESWSVLWPEERRRYGGRNARSLEPERRQS